MSTRLVPARWLKRRLAMPSAAGRLATASRPRAVAAKSTAAGRRKYVFIARPSSLSDRSPKEPIAQVIFCKIFEQVKLFVRLIQIRGLPQGVVRECNSPVLHHFALIPP